MGVTGCPSGVGVAGGEVGCVLAVLFELEQPAMAKAKAAAAAEKSNLRIMTDHPLKR
jgi:hypothetical protein